MRRTVKQLAAAAGVSVRTLHHYDEIGLLHPAEIGANGYRYYGRAELLRLQQILFYRELGLALAEIRPVLDDPAFDPLAALRQHRVRLQSELRRHEGLLRTIDETIDSLERNRTLDESKLYKGISPEKRAEWDREIEERFGEPGTVALAESRKRLGKMNPEESASFHKEAEALNTAFASLMERGVSPEAEETQQIVARHHAWLCKSWTPDAEAYAGLGRYYVEHPEFRAMFETIRPGMAEYMRDAMEAYSRRLLD